MPRPPRPTETTQRLKGDIDAGKGGDKVKQGFDLGLVTLGTDDEAAGTPATPREVAIARRTEERGAARPPPEQSAIAIQRDMPAVWIIVAAFVLVVLVVLAAVWSGRG
jgi:hypothetical protein